MRNLKRGIRATRKAVEELAPRLLHPLGAGRRAFLNRPVPDVELGRELRTHLRDQFLLDAGLAAEYVSGLRSLSAGLETLLLNEALSIRGHVFDLMGSGPVFAGDPIDWHRDLVSGYRWHNHRHYGRYRPTPFPGGADIVVPWELSRCQHFARLGQAYWITRDEAYAIECLREMLDWVNANPWPYGVNWASPMDAAIRAVNWIWGLAFLVDSPSLNDHLLARAAAWLVLHGRHVRANLSGPQWNQYPNNHYLAELVSLLTIALVFPSLRDSPGWKAFSLRELERQAKRQILPDGVSFEASLPYHRLAAEMLAFSVFLCRRNAVEPPAAVVQRLEAMLQVLQETTRPDGRTPVLGDQDNGRLHKLAVWTDRSREWCDYRYLLALGSIASGRTDMAPTGGEPWQEALWIAGPRAVAGARATRRVPTRALTSRAAAFPDGGLYILRARNGYVLVDVGPTGTAGRGAHSHNDDLSFELFAHGQAWLVDPGAYVYTRDYLERHRFRSTAYHNVVLVDEQEVNTLSAARPFDLYEMSPVTVLQWEPGPTACVLKVEQAAYRRLADPVHHQREFVLSSGSESLVLRDHFSCKRHHTYRAFYHLAPHIRVARVSPTDCVLVGARRRQATMQWHLEGLHVDAPQTEVLQGWVSPSYGVRQEAAILAIRWSGRGTCCLSTRVGFRPRRRPSP